MLLTLHADEGIMGNTCCVCARVLDSWWDMESR